MTNKPILFISHAEKDKCVISYFVDLLYQIGLKEENMFCSSLSEIGVPIKENIYEYLRNLLDDDAIVPIFMLSENYYNSAACLNEMGAVWIKQKNYYTFLLPDFEFKQIKGAINPNKRAIKLDCDLRTLKSDLSLFKNELCNLFDLEISEVRWERHRDDFISKITAFGPDVSIDINNCEGFCIGEYNHDGCLVEIDQSLNKVISTIDFSKTNAQLCSIVFYCFELNIKRLLRANKKLHFKLKANTKPSKMTIEMHLNSRNYKYTINPTDNFEEYIIPLSQFCKIEKEWENFKEICFIVDRDSIDSCSIEIKDIQIS